MLSVNFSINLVKKLHVDGKSIIFSPTSIVQALEILLCGSDGITAEELEHAIGYDKQYILEETSKRMKNLRAFDDLGNGVNLMLSNCMFLSQKPLLPAFVESMKNFDTEYCQLDFTDRKSSSQRMNEYISLKTKNQINSVISEEEINPSANLWIINALYLESLWENPFEEVVASIFYSSPNHKRQVQMMNRKNFDEKWNYTEGKTWKCLGMPYKSRKMWLHILLPKKAFGLSDLLNDLDEEMIHEATTKRNSEEIYVSIPSFEIENKLYLKEYLSKLGITQIWSDSNNNHGLHNIFEEQQFVDRFIQSSKIKVNELGTKAASATAVEIVEVIGSPTEKRTFVAHYPFLYFITLVDSSEQLKNILFMGTYY